MPVATLAFGGGRCRRSGAYYRSGGELDVDAICDSLQTGIKGHMTTIVVIAEARGRAVACKLHQSKIQLDVKAIVLGYIQRR